MVRVLITNDDGIGAPGLQALYEGFCDRLGSEHVFVVVPEKERRAVSSFKRSGVGMRSQTLQRWSVKE